MRVRISFMREGMKAQNFVETARTTIGTLLIKYFDTLKQREDSKFYALFFNGTPLNNTLTLADPRFGASVGLVVKEAPVLKCTVTVVNALTCARICLEHCLDVPAAVRQCMEVEAKEASEA